MDRSPRRNAQSGEFIVGRRTTEKISAVEGLGRSERTGRLIALSDSLGESPAQLRERIRIEFETRK
jgi:hypothetical protein